MCSAHYQQSLAERKPGCSIEGCPNRAYARGICASHYYKEQRHGSVAYQREYANKGHQCSADGCDREADKKGLCDYHYQKQREAKLGPCKVDGCDKPARKKGLCAMHHTRMLNHGDVNTVLVQSNKGKTCSVEGCDNAARYRGMCRLHYHHWQESNAPPCSVDGCERQARRKGMCHGHYERVKNHGDANAGLPIGEYIRTTGLPCLVDGCSTPSKAQGLCPKHYKRWGLYGDVAMLKKRPNGSGCVYVNVHGYVIVQHGRHQQKLHRLVMEQALGRDLTPNEAVHHKDGNRLNNELGNLELMTRGEHSRLHHLGIPDNPLNTDTHKQCPKCKQVVARAAYRRWPSSHDGLASYCKPCSRGG